MAHINEDQDTSGEMPQELIKAPATAQADRHHPCPAE